MATVTLEAKTPVCCSNEAKFVCNVTESTSLIWKVQPDITVPLLSTNAINSTIRRGEFEFSLTYVERVNGLFFDLSSTATVTATTAVNGTVIECHNGVDPEMIATLILNSSKYLNSFNCLMSN